MVSSTPIERELVRLLDHPLEHLATEIKDWLNLDEAAVRGDLARELIALANHGGGYVLFGFADLTTGWSPSGPCPHNLKRYSPDAINNILKAHAEPVFDCYTHHLQSSAGTQHVVVQVPGGHHAPIRSRGGPAGSRLANHVYYVRRPGPESSAPQSGAEWDALLARCVDNQIERQLESFRRIITVLQTGPTVARALAELADPEADRLTQWADASLERLQHLGKQDA